MLFITLWQFAGQKESLFYYCSLTNHPPRLTLYLMIFEVAILEPSVL